MTRHEITTALLAIVVAAGSLLSAPASAQTADQRLDRAVDMLLQQGRWQEAVDELTSVLASESLPQQQATRARKFLALGHIFLGNETRAVSVFKDLARHDPSFMMDDLALGEGEDPHEDAVRLYGQAVLEVRLAELEAREAQLLETSRSGALLRSAVLPGWGQMYQGYRNRGLMLMGLAGGSIVFAVLQENAFRDARDAYDNAGEGADFDRLYQDYRDEAANANLAFGAVCGLWALNALDAAIQGPNITRQRLSLEPAPRQDGVRVVLRTSF